MGFAALGHPWFYSFGYGFAALGGNRQESFIFEKVLPSRFRIGR